jgi:hypothetical protein
MILLLRDSVKSLTLIIRQPSTMMFLFDDPDPATITSFAPLKWALWSLLGVAPQTSFIDRRWDVGAFDFEQRTWLALPEEA